MFEGEVKTLPKKTVTPGKVVGKKILDSENSVTVVPEEEKEQEDEEGGDVEVRVYQERSPELFVGGREDTGTPDSDYTEDPAHSLDASNVEAHEEDEESEPEGINELEEQTSLEAVADAEADLDAEAEAESPSDESDEEPQPTRRSGRTGKKRQIFTYDEVGGKPRLENVK